LLISEFEEYNKGRISKTDTSFYNTSESTMNDVKNLIFELKDI